MTMLVKLLLFTCACALGAADEVPPYGDIIDDIIKAYKIINENVLSMDGNIPLLNDSRRHYAEIIKVVSYAGHKENTCMLHDYYLNYPGYVNDSAPFAIANPQKVVDGTNKLIEDIINGVDKVSKLVNKINQEMQANKQDVNKAVDEEINKNVEEYGFPRDLFLQVGVVSSHLNNYHERYFAQQSQDLSAHNFVVTGAAKLENIVYAVANLYAILYGRNDCVGSK